MKALLMSVLLVLGAKAFALGNDVSAKDLAPAKISTSASDLDLDDGGIKYNTTEAGFVYSSINNGSSFASLALVHEFKNGFGLGVRGMMPMTFGSEMQVYLGQILGRFMLLNEETRIALEPTVTQALVSTDFGTSPFVMVGGNFGVTHHFKGDFALGGEVGVDYGTARVSKDKLREGVRALYNHIGFIGTYAF